MRSLYLLIVVLFFAPKLVRWIRVKVIVFKLNKMTEQIESLNHTNIIKSSTKAS